MTACKECRVRTRHEVRGKVRVIWEENGIRRQAMGEIRDISATGLSCWIGNRIAAHTEVRLECQAEHLLGTAMVRHCNGKGMRFLIGVEFRGSLQWQAPGEERTGRGWD
jgi:hypothetical protein